MAKDTNILIVENQPKFLQAQSRVLGKAGYSVFKASSGEKGLNAAKNQKPDIILLTIGLPDLSGIEVCKTIKSDPATKDIYIILISGSQTDEAIVEACFNSGAESFIRRPISERELLVQVHTINRLRKTTEKLRAKQGEINTLLENSPDLIWSLDAQYYLIAGNPTFYSYVYDYAQTNLKPGDYLLNIGLTDKINQEWRGYYDRALGGVNYALEIEIQSSPSPRIIEFKFTPILKSDHSIEGVTVYGRDITNHKLATKALRQWERILNETQRLTKVGGWEWDVINKTMFWTDEVYHIHGLVPGEIKYGSPDHIDRSLECYREEDRKIVWNAFNKCIKKGIEYDLQFPFTRVCGEKIWIRTRARAVKESGKITRIVGNIMDITERVKAEEAMQLFQFAISNSREALYLMGPDSYFIDVSESACKMLGYSKDELLRMSVHDIDSEFSKKVWSSHWDDLRERGSFLIETTHQRKDGITLPVEIGVNYIKFGDKEFNCAFSRDISERKEVTDLMEIERDLGVALAKAESLDEALNTCLEIALQVPGFDSGGIYIVNEQSGDLELIVYRGLSQDFVEFTSYYSSDSENARLVMKARPVYVNYERVRFDLNEMSSKEGLRSAAILPMQHQDQVIGCLNVASHTLESIPMFSRTSLETISSHIGTFIMQTKHHEALQESENRYRSLFEGANDAIFLLDVDGVHIDANKTAADMLGYSLKNLIDLSYRDIVAPHQHAQSDLVLQSLLAGKSVSPYECVFRKSNGDEFPVEINVSLIQSGNDKPLLIQNIVCDITDRKRADSSLRASLNEKDVLLREIHHRVKNNLQVISSLLNIQSRSTQDRQALAALNESRDRVRSMALVHEMLYQSSELAEISFTNYLHSLTARLLRNNSAEARLVKLDIKAAKITLKLDEAIPCGLLVNELVTNSLKHAFPPGRRGIIELEFNETSTEYHLNVCDNGVGIPPKIDIHKTDTLGLRLIHMLVEQLNGKISLTRDHGTKVIIVFPKEDFIDGHEKYE